VHISSVVVRKKLSDFNEYNLLPDFKPVELASMSDPVQPGQAFGSEMHAYNIGNAVATQASVDLYFSEDSLFHLDTDDIGFYLGSREIPSLEAGDGTLIQFDTILPDDVLAGDYYLVAVIDKNQEVVESDEENNNTYSAIPIQVVPPNHSVLVMTHGCGAGFMADTSSYQLHQTFAWRLGSLHSVASDSLFVPNDSIRYVFDRWSDGGAQAHQIVVTDTTDTLTAFYRKEFLLNVISEYRKVTGAGWYAQGETSNFSCDSLVQEEQARRLLSEWAGDFIGSSYNGSMIMDQPKTVSALWKTQYPLSILIEPENGGSVLPGYLAKWMDEGSEITLTAQANTDSGYVFTGWQGDLIGTEPSVTVNVEGPVQMTAVFEKNTTGVTESGIPTEFSLMQNHPNPFNPTTSICYDLPEPSYVRLEIYNMMGSRVLTLVNEVQKA
jgi:uncharacterized repeat protein (TIGR02543 family)